MDGRKEILGLYLAESEGGKFWLSVLIDHNNRGVEDILIASVDGRTSFPEVIEAVFPQTDVQLCIVRQIRNSLRYIVARNHKALMVDLKRAYRADTLAAAESSMDDLAVTWGEKYPL